MKNFGKILSTMTGNGGEVMLSQDVDTKEYVVSYVTASDTVVKHSFFASQEEADKTYLNVCMWKVYGF